MVLESVFGNVGKNPPKNICGSYFLINKGAGCAKKFFNGYSEVFETPFTRY